MRKFLLNNKTSWFTSKEIAQWTNKEVSSVTRIMKKMREYREVQWRKIPYGNKRTFQYRWLI